MMRGRLTVMLMCGALAAQERADVDWAVVLAGRYAELRNPVAAAWAIAELASKICQRDRGAAAPLFDQAIARVNQLPAAVFAERGSPLPVASFSGLWRLAAGAASRCDPKFDGAAPGPALGARIAEERQRANSDLAAARETIGSNPDRAAQLAGAALEAGDPRALDFALLVRFLAELRDRAPDLADEMFEKTLGFINSAPELRARFLAMLADYLFVAPELLDKPDKDLERKPIAAGGLTFSDLTAMRRSANPEDATALIENAVQAFEREQPTAGDAPAAYALMRQLLGKAGDYAPDLEERFRTAFDSVRTAAGGVAASIEPALPPAAPDALGGETARARHRLIGAALKAASAGRIGDAREIASRVDDQDVRGQIEALIRFAESARAVEAKDIERAASAANALRGGVKRALLYAAIVPAAGGDFALQMFHLALRDIEPLPAEHRVALLAAVAAAMFRVDLESAWVALKLAVEASNDAAARPRRARFNPKLVRAIYRGTESAPADSGLIVMSARRVYEAVDDGIGRHSFALRAPGVTALRLPEAVRAAPRADVARLEAILLDLRDETRRVQALSALAALRLKAEN
jgi:hypothetical protein